MEDKTKFYVLNFINNDKSNENYLLSANPNSDFTVLFDGIKSNSNALYNGLNGYLQR
jgi:hypothetical protein